MFDADFFISKYGFLKPMPIDHPERGFNGYLLRCKAPSEEKGSNTFLLWAPEDTDVHVRRLSDEINDRLATRKDWWHKTTAGVYTCINCDLVDLADFDTACEVFSGMTVTDMETVGGMVIASCMRICPGAVPFAAVCHSEQLIYDEEDMLCVRPPHFHVLLRNA